VTSRPAGLTETNHQGALTARHPREGNGHTEMKIARRDLGGRSLDLLETNQGRTETSPVSPQEVADRIGTSPRVDTGRRRLADTEMNHQKAADLGKNQAGLARTGAHRIKMNDLEELVLKGTKALMTTDVARRIRSLDTDPVITRRGIVIGEEPRESLDNNLARITMVTTETSGVSEHIYYFIISKTNIKIVLERYIGRITC